MEAGVGEDGRGGGDTGDCAGGFEVEFAEAGAERSFGVEVLLVQTVLFVYSSLWWCKERRDGLQGREFIKRPSSSLMMGSVGWTKTTSLVPSSSALFCKKAHSGSNVVSPGYRPSWFVSTPTPMGSCPFIENILFNSVIDSWTLGSGMMAIQLNRSG